MADSSMDIMASVDVHEIDNAWQQAVRDIGQRWDFKGKTAELEWNKGEKKVTVTASDKMVQEAMLDIFTTKLAKRGINTKALELKSEEPAHGGATRQIYTIIDGIPADKAKEINKLIKEKAPKGTSSQTQGESIRVSAKKRDALQDVIAMLKAEDVGIPLQFQNFRD